MEPLRQLSRHLRERYGLSINTDAAALVDSRLREYAEKSGDGDVGHLVNRLISLPEQHDILEIAGFVINSHSFFYREPSHFDLLTTKALPELDSQYLRGKGADLRVWSAGSAEGDEPYTLVMVMREYFGDRYDQLEAGVLATDISTPALKRGVAGEYHLDRLRFMPGALRSRYTEQVGPERIRVVDKVRNDVLFRWLNLLDPAVRFKGKFHIIFCRNVMVYFEEATQARLTERLAGLLAPGGYLFLSHTDNASFARRLLTQIRPSVYRNG